MKDKKKKETLKCLLLRKYLPFPFLFIFSIFFLILILFSQFLSIPLWADDSLAIIEKIIDTDDEKILIEIVEKWQNSSDENASLYVGIAYHNLALIDSIKYASLSVSWLSKYNGKKHISIATAYKGSAITLVANAYSKKNDFMTASAKLTEGFELIDKAIKMDPQNVIIRFLRAENGIEITETTPFNRSKEVEEDLNFLATKLSNFTNIQKAQYYLILGRLKLFQKKINEAIAALRQVIKEAPDSKYAQIARKILSKLED